MQGAQKIDGDHQCVAKIAGAKYTDNDVDVPVVMRNRFTDGQYASLRAVQFARVENFDGVRSTRAWNWKVFARGRHVRVSVLIQLLEGLRPSWRVFTMFLMSIRCSTWQHNDISAHEALRKASAAGRTLCSTLCSCSETDTRKALAEPSVVAARSHATGCSRLRRFSMVWTAHAQRIEQSRLDRVDHLMVHIQDS